MIFYRLDVLLITQRLQPPQGLEEKTAPFTHSASLIPMFPGCIASIDSIIFYFDCIGPPLLDLCFIILLDSRPRLKPHKDYLNIL